MRHFGRFLLLLLAAALLVLGYTWWSAKQRFPVDRPAADLVLQQADLPAPLVPVGQDTGAIPANPYDDYTEHYRSGFRAVFTGMEGSEWQETRLISTTFVVDQKGAVSVFNAYAAQTLHRGQTLSLPPLGEQSLFLVAHNEPSAPVVIIGAVRVQNVLVTLTVMTDQDLDPALVHRWAEVLVQRSMAR